MNSDRPDHRLPVLSYETPAADAEARFRHWASVYLLIWAAFALLARGASALTWEGMQWDGGRAWLQSLLPAWRDAEAVAAWLDDHVLPLPAAVLAAGAAAGVAGRAWGVRLVRAAAWALLAIAAARLACLLLPKLADPSAAHRSSFLELSSLSTTRGLPGALKMTAMLAQHERWLLPLSVLVVLRPAARRGGGRGAEALGGRATALALAAACLCLAAAALSLRATLRYCLWDFAERFPTLFGGWNWVEAAFYLAAVDACLWPSIACPMAVGAALALAGRDRRCLRLAAWAAVAAAILSFAGSAAVGVWGASGPDRDPQAVLIARAIGWSAASLLDDAALPLAVLYFIRPTRPKERT